MMISGRARYLVESSKSASGTHPYLADDVSWNLVDLSLHNSWIFCRDMVAVLAVSKARPTTRNGA